MSIKIRSEEVNLLVYSYLLEAGLSHTAYVLSNEASLFNAAEQFSKVAPGALLSLLERALLLALLEAHCQEDQLLGAGKPQCKEEFGLLQPHVCQYSQFPFPPPDLSNGLPHEVDSDFIELSGHEAPVSHLLTRDCDVLTGSQDGQARLWRIGQSLAESRPFAILPHVTEKGQCTSIQALDWSPKGKVATLTADGLVRLWSSSGEMLYILNTNDEITKLRWNTSGDTLLTLNKSSRMQAWDYKGFLKQTFKQTPTDIVEIDWKNETEFASGTETGEVLIWTVQSELPLFQISKGKHKTDFLKWQPGGSSLAWVQGAILRVWCEGTDIEIPVSDCRTLDWIGGLLITGHSSGCLNVWDARSASLHSTFQPHTSGISKIKVRTDGEFLATLAGCELTVWSSKHWKVVKRLTAPSTVVDIAWSSEGTRLVFTYGDKLAVMEFSV
mmetsp:Transcript_22591/g.40661  ORF Transcript_22591/g.40661 Transcript_22591/m.40661 type:complete len:441 (-) Transcript_22591:1018-2340(-)